MALAWTRELVGGILGIFGVGNESRGAAITIMVLAVFLIYVLDFAINVRELWHQHAQTANDLLTGRHQFKQRFEHSS